MQSVLIYNLSHFYWNAKDVKVAMKRGRDGKNTVKDKTKDNEAIESKPLERGSKARRILEGGWRGVRNFGARTFDKVKTANYRGMPKNMKDKARSAFAKLTRGRRTYEGKKEMENEKPKYLCTNRSLEEKVDEIIEIIE